MLQQNSKKNGPMRRFGICRDFLSQQQGLCFWSLLRALLLSLSRSSKKHLSHHRRQETKKKSQKKLF